MALLLLVDDSRNILELLEDICEKLGHDYLTARDGKEGLDVFLNNEIDMVITDRQMPVMDGEEFTEKIKESGSEVPVVMYTGWSPGVNYDNYHDVISKDNISHLMHCIQGYFCT